MLSWEFPPNICGGLGIACYEIFSHLQGDFEMKLATPQHHQISGYSPYKGRLLKKIKKFTEQLIHCYGESDFQIIYAHDWLTIPAALLLKKKSRKPLVLHFHSLEQDRTMLESNPEVCAIEKEGIVTADMIICVSQYAQNKLLTLYPEAAHKTYSVHLALSSKFNLIENQCANFIQKNKKIYFLLVD